MAGERVRAYLEEHGVTYEVHEHPREYTAQRMAARAHESGWHVAKPVMVTADGLLGMVVLAAPQMVDTDRVAAVFDAHEARLASEREFAAVFPDCEVGAEPPFGPLYGVRMVVDAALLQQPRLVFADGSHDGSLSVETRDYRRLVEPTIAEVGSEA